MKWSFDFFTADNHFDDPRVLKFVDRGPGTPEEVWERQVDAWNAVVPPKARVLIDGDFAQANVAKWASRLKGSKYLVMGTHDHIGVDDIACFSGIVKVPSYSNVG